MEINFEKNTSKEDIIKATNDFKSDLQLTIQ